MPTDSMTTVLTCLARNDFQAIIGTLEGHDLDFKLSPYPLDAAKGKWELAKDVAAFANASGGCLLIGVREEQQAHHVAAVAAEIRPVPKAIVNISRYRDLLAQWIVPTVEGVAFRWYPDAEEATEGLLLIQIPPQPERVRPFLVTQVVDADGGTVNAVAWPKRNEDRIEWTRPERVQHHLNIAGTVAERMTELTAGRRPEPTVDLCARAVDLRLAANAGEDPCIVVQAQPPAPLDMLPRLYGPDGLVGALRAWKGIRNLGFDLTSGGEPEPENGNLLLKGQVSGDKPGWLLRVASDGLLQLAIPFQWHFLGWAMRQQGDPTPVNPRVNSMALVEIVLDFFRLLRSRVDPTGTWNGRVAAWSMQDLSVELHAGYRRREMWGFPTKPSVATGNDYAQTFACTGPAEHDAFECLFRLYGLWGLGKDAIPFSKNEAIVPAEIVAIRS